MPCLWAHWGASGARQLHTTRCTPPCPLSPASLVSDPDACVQTVTGVLEAQAEQDGCKLELESFVDHSGWRKPLFKVGFSF